MRLRPRRALAMHDVYDPPPVPEIEWEKPRREPLDVTRGDVACLVGLCLALFAVSAWLGRSEPVVAVIAAGAGSLIVLESWLTALARFKRTPTRGSRARGAVFLAALVPWVVGVGAAVAFLLGVFWISDHFPTP